MLVAACEATVLQWAWNLMNEYLNEYANMQVQLGWCCDLGSDIAGPVCFRPLLCRSDDKTQVANRRGVSAIDSMRT